MNIFKSLLYNKKDLPNWFIKTTRAALITVAVWPVGFFFMCFMDSKSKADLIPDFVWILIDFFPHLTIILVYLSRRFYSASHTLAIILVILAFLLFLIFLSPLILFMFPK